MTSPQQNLGVPATPVNDSSGLQCVGPEAFIASIFSSKGDDELVCVTKPISFQDKETGKIVNTFANRSMHDPEFCAFLYGDKPADWYVCISSVEIPAANGKIKRGRAQIKFTYCIVLDDVGTKVKEEDIPLQPSWKIETSLGNFQWGYKIARDDWQGEVEALINALIAQGMSDPGAVGVYRIVRVPGSINMKPQNNKFPARLTEWNPELTRTLDELALAFGVDITNTTERNKCGADSTTTIPDVYTDPILKWLDERQMLGADNGKFITVPCPWQSKHTNQDDDSTGYSPVGHGEDTSSRYFSCFHGSHDGEGPKNTASFLNWVAEQGGPICLGHDEPTWLDEMNSQFMVVNEAGKISVYRQTTDPVLNRAYLETFTFDDLKRAYLNVRVVVGTDNNGEPIYKTKGDAWLRHEQRMQYLA